ncbi:hypothetical protein FGG79_04915 [Bacillus sp. BHET2]|uniref:hypothetical protein n=1 Tax=Bacillus sp. BHET2 TaxID=2583818 RepID=UPI00110D6033|nr:hypothetical protein [Bacillus sp. BHET2]TMU87469.1 hypothetical protein FGG79_04915 [Bacillus sp. BHET2]
MWINFLITFMVSLGILYLVRFRINLKYAADKTSAAIYPISREEMNSILIPTEYKEMKPLTKRTKSYQWVKWGSRGVIIVCIGLIWSVFRTDWLHEFHPIVLYMFIMLIGSIKHRGNFYLLPDGLILNGYFIPWNRVKEYRVEKIMKFHELYGLDEKINHGFKLNLIMKNKWFQRSYIVIREHNQLQTILSHLKQRGVEGTMKMDSGFITVQKN